MLSFDQVPFLAIRGSGPLKALKSQKVWKGILS
jgi:hypothetical protein